MDDERDDMLEDLDASLDAELLTDQPANGSEAATGDEATDSLRDLVTYIVSNLVDDPEAAEITVDRRGASVHIQLRLPEDDLGKVIGRGGRIAKAIRTVLLVAGSRHHLRVSLDIES